MTASRPTVHASAVKVGDRAVLIRGPSGAGKSMLAFGLILAGRAGQIPPVELIGDDRVMLGPDDGRLWVRYVPELAGLIEIRGLGIRRCNFFAGETPVALVVDLAAADASRLPPPAALRVRLEGVEMPRLPVGGAYDPLPLVLAWLSTAEGVIDPVQLDDCRKENGNHISHTIVSD